MFSKLLIASGNPGKIKEITERLTPYAIEVIGAPTLNITEPEETGQSFAENAELKARYYAKASQMPALADDSGLCVEALHGAPGIYSARLAGKEKDFNKAMRSIEAQLKEQKKTTSKAHFICALALHIPEGETVTFEGRIDGSLTFPPRGDLGFGYDPIFVPQGHDKTFAEFPPEKKHQMSHRARAFEQLEKWLDG